MAVVLVLVGKEEQKSYIHENLLTSNSDFFKKALTKDWKEGQERIVTMPEIEVDIFKIWMQWLYTGKMFLTKEDDIYTTPEGILSWEWARWEGCYNLADFLQDHDFKDACIDVAVEAMSSTGRWTLLLPRALYAHSPRGSAHRQLAIDAFVLFCKRSWWGDSPGAPIEWYKDVLKRVGPQLDKAIKRQSLKVYFDSVTACQYHNHGPDKVCYRTKPAFQL